jgi:methyl-accepting chemotaxis protein
VQQAGNAGEALEQIRAAVSTITQMNIQIASAANQQVAVSAEINQNVSNINDAVAHSSDSAAQIAEASSELAMLSARLQQLLGQFRL